MRIFALELDNDIKGIARRDAYVEDLIRRLPESITSLGRAFAFVEQVRL